MLQVSMGEEAKAAERGTRSWWQTVPGLLTAAAGLISAVTGLLVALNAIGVFSDDTRSPRATQAATAAGGVAGTTSAGAGGSHRVTFPGGARATLGTSVYELTGGQAEPSNPGELELRLSVRLTNNGPYDVNFWDRTFRLLVDGLSRAPTSGLNDLVAGRSVGEGTVTFAVPEAANELVLLVGEDADAVRLPVALEPGG
jgi:hypothetical protein